LKRFALVSVMLVAFVAAGIATSPRAQAGLFGGGKAASPSPSPSPSAIPTASPEPPDVAIPRLQAKLKANPNDQQAMTDLATEFLQVSRPDLAVQLTQHLIQMGDKTAQVYYIDGYAMQQLGKQDAAIDDLENAATVDPSNMGVLRELADLYLRANRFTDAERIANRAIKLNPTDEAAYETLGSVQAAEQKYDDARLTFEKAASMDPKNAGPLVQIASTYAAQDNIPIALQSIDRALALDPKDVQTLVFKADLYAKEHDDARASAAYDDAIVASTSDDEKAGIMIRKAQYYASEKKFSLAEATFQQAIAQYPKQDSLYTSFGDYWINQKNLNNAVTEYQAALAINKSDASALARLGQIAMQSGKMNDAVTYLKQLVAVAPDPQAFAMLGQAYSYLHDYASSKDACGKSFQLQREPGTLACIGGADYELKNYKEAAQIFDILDANAHGFLDQNPQFLYVAAKCYQQTNQKPKALAAYKRLLPMMKKGTKDYSEVTQAIATLSKPAHAPAKAPAHG